MRNEVVASGDLLLRRRDYRRRRGDEDAETKRNCESYTDCDNKRNDESCRSRGGKTNDNDTRTTGVVRLARKNSTRMPGSSDMEDDMRSVRKYRFIIHYMVNT